MMSPCETIKTKIEIIQPIENTIETKHEIIQPIELNTAQKILFWININLGI